MEKPRLSGKAVASMLAFSCICLVVATAGILLSDSVPGFGAFRDGFGNYFDSKQGENQEELFRPDPGSFTVPKVPAYFPRENEETPVLRTPMDPGFSLSTSYQTAEFYQGAVSYIRVNVKNEGKNPIFIDRYGVSVSNSENLVYSEDCGALLDPEEEQCLGVLSVRMPEGEAKPTLNIVLWLLASTSEGKWHEYEPQFLEEFTVEAKPVPPKLDPPYKYNTLPYFGILNGLVEPEDLAVRKAAAESSEEYPGAFNIYQVCALFDRVSVDIGYINDPRGSDIWEPANATLKIGAGDCEDQAILLASLIEAVGGTTRLYLTDNHAFAAAYIGNETETTDAIIKGVRAYYGNVDVYYLTDDYGSWLMLDPSSSLYAGGLPGTTAPAKLATAENPDTLVDSWTFMNTSGVQVIDISSEATG
jgi:transglutaminase-like putative cysteine protease